MLLRLEPLKTLSAAVNCNELVHTLRCLIYLRPGSVPLCSSFLQVPLPLVGALNEFSKIVNWFPEARALMLLIALLCKENNFTVFSAYSRGLMKWGSCTCTVALTCMHMTKNELVIRKVFANRMRLNIRIRLYPYDY
jgi:hypothetical protein